MAVNQEVQWGVRSDGQPGDGEKIRTGDLNDMQRLLTARMSDWNNPVCGAYGELAQGDASGGIILPAIFDDMTALCRSRGQGGWPYASATTRTLTNRAGVIVQRVASPTGLAPSVLEYPLAEGELATQFDAGEAVNLRIDSVFVKLDEAGANDAGTLLTGQAIHQKSATPPYETTSQGYYSRLRVRCAKSVVKGTPHATTPVAPATPTGYARYADVYIPATWSAVIDPLNIRDQRVPARLVWTRYGAKHWNSGTWTVNTDLMLASAAAGNIARLEMDKSHSPAMSRLLWVGGAFRTNATGGLLSIMRYSMQAPFSSAVPVRETEMENHDATLATAIDADLQFAPDPPIWMSGFRAGGAMLYAQGFGSNPAAHSVAGLKITAASNADKIMGVWTLTAEP